MMDQSDIPYMTGIDVRDSKVELYVYDKQELLDYLKNMKMELPAHTRINEVDRLGEEVENIYGGKIIKFFITEIKCNVNSCCTLLAIPNRNTNNLCSGPIWVNAGFIDGLWDSGA
jgi:hypothetical protein